jgi:hypothetical protein
MQVHHEYQEGNQLLPWSFDVRWGEHPCWYEIEIAGIVGPMVIVDGAACQQIGANRFVHHALTLGANVVVDGAAAIGKVEAWVSKRN